jgi:hypothetical protein
MGVAGALMVALALRRGQWPEAWRRNLLWNLGVLLLIQLFIGWAWPIIDNYAHVGGLAGGALAALMLVPGGPLGRAREGGPARRFDARMFAVLVALAVLGGSAARAIASLVRERPLATLEALPRKRLHAGGVSLVLPVGSAEEKLTKPDWPGEIALVDQVAGMSFSPHFLPAPGGLTAVLAACMERDRALLRKQANDPNLPFEAAEVVPADGWTAAAQAPPGRNPPAMLYYARAVPGGQALVVEVSYSGRERDYREVIAAELGRVMASVTVEK